MTLIDTSCWIQFLRKKGDGAVKARVAGYIDLGEAAYAGPVQLELIAGAKDRELEDLRDAFRFSAFLVFPSHCWKIAGQLERKLRQKGLTIPMDDILVSATAIHHDVSVYAQDKHFEMIKSNAAPHLRLVT